jgi:hypothetical protein
VRIRLAIPDHLLTPAALEAALEAVALADAEAIKRGEVPHAVDAIRAGGKWQPEPYPGEEHFDLAHVVAARGHGDCDDWAPWLTGSLRASGEDEGARTRVVQTGKDRWHALTEMSDGRILDPSVWAGMGRRSGPSNPGVSGRTAAPFARPSGGALAVMPHSGMWWARCDVPWPDGVTGHLSSHACAHSPDVALDQAVAGAVVCGEQINSPLVERAREVALTLLADSEAARTHESEVGSIFGSILHSITHPSLHNLIHGPLGFVANPAMALSYHTLHDKKFAPARDLAARFVPGAQMLTSAPGMLDQAEQMVHHPSVLTALTHGAGKPGAPGAITEPTGGVSVALPESETPAHGQQKFLYFHPSGTGPVVMRF